MADKETDLNPESDSSGRVPERLVDRVPSLLWTTDTKLQFTTLDGAALSTFGIQRQRYIGLGILSLFRESNSRQNPENAHQLCLSGEGGTFAFSLSGREMTARVEPLLGPDGRCTGTVGTAQDDTERLVAERALSLSENNFRSLIEEIPYAICRATREGQLLQVNRAMLEMLGYGLESEADLLMRDLPGDIFLTAEGFDEFTKALNQGKLRGFESCWRSRLGRNIDVNLGGRLIRYPNGEVWYMDVLAEDVTDRRKLELQWRQAQRMQSIGQLAGGIAHDFNNLLMEIQGQAEMLLERSSDPDGRERLREITSAAERASFLTKQLLAFGRRQVLQSRDVDLNVVIGRMSHMLTRLIRENILFSFTPADQPACVRIDSSQIEQVMMNLVVNARDAMPHGGRLSIEVSNINFYSVPSSLQDLLDPGPYVLITVSDTGLGMDPETQSRIFEPFFTTKEPGNGSGMGLSMAYGVVRQSGGEIHVESAIGMGATFRIYLPRLPEAAEVLSPVPVVTQKQGGETILYAEDNASLRELIYQYLTGLGYHVLCAADGAVALEIARHHAGAVRLLVSDLMMPNVGGIELARELRKTLPGLKVLFVSGYAGDPTEEGRIAVPEATYLTKPVPMQLLANTIRNLLDSASS